MATRCAAVTSPYSLQAVDELQAHVSAPSFLPLVERRHLCSIAESSFSNAQGINVSDISKLKVAGIVTVLGVAQTPRKNLAKIKVGASRKVV